MVLTFSVWVTRRGAVVYSSTGFYFISMAWQITPANRQKKAPVIKLDPPGPSIKSEATERKIAAIPRDVEFFTTTRLKKILYLSSTLQLDTPPIKNELLWSKLRQHTTPCI
jgi:hypothetical protein